MPYSTIVPPLVFPDTHEARLDARKQVADDLVEFCNQYVPDTHLSSVEARRLRGASKGTVIDGVNLCRNREPMGDRKHNWCWRCMAGFAFVVEDHESQ